MNSLFPLSDQAALAYFPDEAAALRFAKAARTANDPWLVDVVAAYTSVAIFFDLDRIHFRQAAERLRTIDAASQAGGSSPDGPLHHVPCCYELGPDLAHVAKHADLSVEEVIRLHAETIYTVYAIGFCPGFPYLGYLPPKLCGVPRRETPRLRVEAGSVGMTGRQTGIYTEERPGGWNLIGRTPLELVNVRDGYFPLRAGDRLRFERVDQTEFGRRFGQRL